MDKKYLYSPWRLEYILSGKDSGCIFCSKPEAENDVQHLIVYRSKHCYVILNLYPYNNGHIMVVPLEHANTLSKLSKVAYNDVFSTVRLAETVLNEVYKCEGMNIGINIGKAAGAGVDEHIHVHLVPRWNGDGNFMSVVGGERVIPEAFDRAYKKLKTAFNRHRKTKSTR
jgi:ATP adenylyltransferase